MSNAIAKVKRVSVRRRLENVRRDPNSTFFGKNVKVANVLRLREALSSENLREIVAHLLNVRPANVSSAVAQLTLDQLSKLRELVQKVSRQLHREVARQRWEATMSPPKKAPSNAAQSV